MGTISKEKGSVDYEVTVVKEGNKEQLVGLNQALILVER
jgi:hypothetical protein